MRGDHLQKEDQHHSLGSLVKKKPKGRVDLNIRARLESRNGKKVRRKAQQYLP